MRLICPSCDAQYEVADNVIPEAGRDVQCSNCGTTWFQKPVVAAAPPAPKPDNVPVSRDRDDRRTDPAWETERPAAGETASAPPPEPPRPSPPRVSADAASILREEAMRELKARLADKPRVETQPDFGLMPPKETPASPAGVHEGQAPAPAPSGRDRLPEIEEASIGAPGPAAPSAPAATRAGAQDDAAYRRAFRSGFGLSLAAGIAAAALYVYAPQIGAKVPAAQPVLAAYVARADQLRGMLDMLVGKAARGA